MTDKDPESVAPYWYCLRGQNFEWTQRNFAFYFRMMCDLHFFDIHSLKYAVHKIITGGIKEFGGYDSVVLWHAYVVDQFHRNGIRVFTAYRLWDNATRREEGTDGELLEHILKEIDGDGIFLDTIKAGGAEFTQLLNSFKQEGIALESELVLDLEEIGHHHLS